MAILFLDSSAVAKHYITEQGSQWIRTLLDPDAGNELHVSVLAGVEVISAIIRRRRMGSLDATTSSAAISEFLDDWQYLFSHVAVDERIIDVAMELAERHELRGYDAVHLAAALIFHGRSQAMGLTMTLVSADGELNAAAVAEGLQVENPKLHP